MAQVVIENLSKSYGDVNVVRDFSLRIEDGEFVALVGPSGCGKSTMLKMLAGLETPDGGSVRIGDRNVTYAAPGDRDIAMVFQSYALYPHLTVRRNMEFGLRMQGVAKASRRAQVEDMAETLGITPLLERRPSELSGGQRQRVALGRAMVRHPRAFLMDEPLSNLDAKLRVHMRAEIATMHKRVGVTTIYVTHDQTEAMTMADRIVVLNGGVIQQIASPQEMFDNPDNVFVAGFIGTPSMNFIRSSITRDGNSAEVDLFGTRIRYENVSRTEGEAETGEVILGIRPEHFLPPEDGLPNVTITPELIERLGSEKLIHFSGTAVNASLSEGPDAAAGEGPDAPSYIAKVKNQLDVAENEGLALGVSPDQLLMFDLRTQKRIESHWKS